VVALVGVGLVATLAPWIVGERAFAVDLGAILLPPSWHAPLGTDENGRDALARLMYGAGLTIGVGVGAALVSLAVGTTIGAVAGYAGGAVDAAAMRIVDFALAFPGLFVILFVSALITVGPLGLVLVIGLTGWMSVARLLRGSTRSIALTAYVESAHASGATGARVVVRHVLPNELPVLLVAGLTQVNRCILAEATASYLGVGIKPPTPTWGSMLVGAQDYLWTAPWLALAPGLAITLTIFTVHLASVRIGGRAPGQWR
jgi:peptide/nickel transport system permease protein